MTTEAMRITTCLILLCAATSIAAAQTPVVEAKDSGGFSLLRLHDDGGFIMIGNPASGSIPATGQGTRVMWYPAKAAFRAGHVDGTNWDDANIGASSTAMGRNTMASATGSTAMGGHTTASGVSSTAMGGGTIASGESSTALGHITRASGDYSTAIGRLTTAQANGSLVIGRYNLISGTPDSWVDTEPLFVAGNGVATGDRANALTLLKNGNLTLAGSVESESGGFVFPDGTVQTTAAGAGMLTTNGAGAYDLGNDDGLVAEGSMGTGAIPATGRGTRLMWYPGEAAFRAGRVTGQEWDDANTGPHSVAMGLNTTASGDQSTAMGDVTTASGFVSTALGGLTTASGAYSTAIGVATTGQAYGSLVIGRFNLVSGTPDSWVDTDPLFVVGNGTFSTPSNALTLLKNGHLGIGTANPTAMLHLRNDSSRIAVKMKASGSWTAELRQTDGSLFSIHNGGQARLAITAGGNVGIGTTSPTAELEVDGTVQATTVVQTSDARLKNTVQPIDDALERVRRLRGVTFEWDRARHPERAFETGRRVGFLAQEVQAVLPEVVREDGSGYLSVAYQEVMPVLVEALKEQQDEITTQRAENKQQQAEIEAQRVEIEQLKTRLARLEEGLTTTAER